MKKIYRLIGGILLSFAALTTIIGPASAAQIAVEDMPESMRSKR